MNFYHELGNFKEKNFSTSKCKIFLHFKATDPKSHEKFFFSFTGTPLPKKLLYPAAVSIDGDMFLIGGYEYQKGWHSTIYKLICKSEECYWTHPRRPGTVLPQTLRLGRSQMVAVAVPDDFFDCN